ncbi:MAG: DUF2135 domain-containing protein, partial [Burkholderiales bacterium]
GRLQARAANGPRLLTDTRGAQTYFHADLPVGDAPQSRVKPQHIALVWDASGSAGGTSHARELALLDHYFRTLGTARVTLYFLRDTLSAASEHQLRGGDWTTLRRALEAAQYDGATRLQSLAQVSTADAMIVVTDGLSNYGAGEIATPSIPTHLVTAAVRSNPPLLARLAGRSGGRFIDLTRITPQAAATALTAIPERIAGVTADGASDFAYANYYVEAGRIVVAGVLSEPATMLRIELVDANGRRRTVTQRIDGAAPRSNIATALWGELRLAELEGEYDVNRMAIRRLGAKLGLATRETSLLVLERLEDYVRNEIEPPSSLRAAYQAQLTMQRRSVEQNRSAHIERVTQRYAERGKWWDQNYPKGERAIALAPAEPRVRSEGAHDRLAAGLADQPHQRNEAARPPTSAAASAPQRAPSVALDARRAATEAPAAGAARQSTAKVAGNMDARAARIQLKAWTPDAPYAKRLESATVTDRYRVYLDERAGYTASTAFFLDAADFFLAKNERALGLRILSNLAEMDLENRHILRILGYRLMQANEPALAAPVFARVLALAPNEPQSYRDLGLALARSGEPQRAIDALYEVVVRPWDSRFPEIDLVALTELNAIVATAGKPLDTSKIESRLLRNLPVDLRVVLSWDADNTDIDLWVTDPNGERAHYGHRNTYQGGRMSADFTGGYGPEEFILKNAKPGKYKVEANFYGHRQQVVAGATTLMLALQTGFGTERADERRVTLRLRGQSEVVFVGEFEIGAP